MLVCEAVGGFRREVLCGGVGGVVVGLELAYFPDEGVALAHGGFEAGFGVFKAVAIVQGLLAGPGFVVVGVVSVENKISWDKLGGCFDCINVKLNFFCLCFVLFAYGCKKNNKS